MIALALLWGICEGTWFFLVPDILLSFYALKSTRLALRATLAVVLGSMLAAVILNLMLKMGWVTPEGLYHFFSCFPGFRIKMTELAHEHLLSSGARGLLLGPSSGIPYRIYAVEAAKLQIPLLNFLVWTPLARLERVVIAPTAVSFLRYFTLRIVQRRAKNPVLAERNLKRFLPFAVGLYWIVLYAWYWGVLVPTLYGA